MGIHLFYFYFLFLLLLLFFIDKEKRRYQNSALRVYRKYTKEVKMLKLKGEG